MLSRPATWPAARRRRYPSPRADRIARREGKAPFSRKRRWDCGTHRNGESPCAELVAPDAVFFDESVVRLDCFTVLDLPLFGAVPANHLGKMILELLREIDLQFARISEQIATDADVGGFLEHGILFGHDARLFAHLVCA